MTRKNKGNPDRIFVGVSETVDVCRLIARGLAELGYPVTVALTEFDSPILIRPNDSHRVIKFSNPMLHQLRLFGEFIRTFHSHDVFIFRASPFSGSLVKSRWTRWVSYTDAKLLRLFGKKVIYVATGSDIRNPKLLVENLRKHNEHEIANATDATFTGTHLQEIPRVRAKKIENTADFVYAQPDYSDNLSNSYNLLWIPFDLDSVVYKVNRRDRPIVVHAPSNALLKGTYHVLEAVESLKREGLEFQFKLLEGVSNSDVKKSLADSDIALDQFFTPSYGVFAIEAMAAGCAVLGLSTTVINTQLADSPVIQTNHLQITDHLRSLIKNQPEIARRARMGREWVKANHDYRNVAKQIASESGLHNNEDND